MTVQFDKLHPSKLSRAAIVPQVLDNQWVPRPLLEEMIKEKKGLSQVKNEREKHVLKEWRRALVYGEQVVVNRAFMFNNAIIVDDYDDAANREHFKELLNTGIIIPYLYTENSPDEPPLFTVDPILWKTWTNLVSETKMSCVRLDWDKQDDDFARLAKIYHDYIQNLNTNAKHLSKYFGIPENEIPNFVKRMNKVLLFAVKHFDETEKYVTRNDLYREFVCEDGSSVPDGYYSSSKPYSAAIKQILDLKYNVNLPDALGRYALTPEDSPPRSALNDLSGTVQVQQITNENVDDVLYALKRLAFDNIAQGLYINSLASIGLADVLKIRDTGEWKEYRTSMNNLLDDPLAFAHRSAVLYAKFEALNERITRIKLESGTATAVWQPWVKFFITVGAKTIELLINPAAPQEKYWTEVGSEAIATGVTPFLMRMAITTMTHTDADLEFSLDFMRRNVANGRDTMNEIIATLKETQGFKMLKDVSVLKHDATINQPEGA